jgi:hypothetical protein
MPETIGMKTARVDGYSFLKTITLLFTLTTTLSYFRLNLHLVQFSITLGQKGAQATL